MQKTPNFPNTGKCHNLPIYTRLYINIYLKDFKDLVISDNFLLSRNCSSI